MCGARDVIQVRRPDGWPSQGGRRASISSAIAGRIIPDQFRGPCRPPNRSFECTAMIAMGNRGRRERPMADYLLNKTSIAKYVLEIPHIARRLGNRSESWDVEEVSQGNVNHVYVVRGAAGSVCVKQAP